MKKLLLSTLLLTSLQSFAALPPLWNSVNRIKVVFGQETLKELQKTEFYGSIIEVKEIDHLTYQLLSKDCYATVNLKSIPLPKGMMGASQFKFKNIEAACKLY